jgi:hypothetical protein
MNTGYDFIVDRRRPSRHEVGREAFASITSNDGGHGSGRRLGSGLDHAHVHTDTPSNRRAPPTHQNMPPVGTPAIEAFVIAHTVDEFLDVPGSFTQDPLPRLAAHPADEYLFRSSGAEESIVEPQRPPATAHRLYFSQKP